ncbi:MAG: hypothetical protein IJC81_05190 [Clostridia bacterium]|nr:hypothetical protein [Clostridia bacterium]
MKNRFKPNDTVMYGGHGACTMVEIAEKDFGGDLKDYYVLRPAFSGSSVFYVPIDSEPLTAKMRRIKNADEILKLITEIGVWEWIDDDRSRQNQLKQIVDGSSTETLLAVFKTMYERQAEFAESGKKLRAADDRYMKDIENLLLEEFSFSFEIQKEELIPFINSEITLNKK